MAYLLYRGMALKLAEANFRAQRSLEWLVLHVFLSINLSHCTHHTFRLSGMAWQFVSITATCIVAPFEEDREREARVQFCGGGGGGRRRKATAAPSVCR